MAVEKKNPNRIEKVNATLQKLIGVILLDTLEKSLGIVTVSKVETSRDMKYAKIWISILNGDDDKILNILQRRIYEIQGEINRQLPVKIVPKVKFFLDTSPRYVQHIDELIKKIHEPEQ